MTIKDDKPPKSS